MENSDTLRCRLCFENSSDLINLYSEETQPLNIHYVLSLHLWFEIKEDDPISKYICSTCWLNVTSFHTFYNKILEIQNSDPFKEVKNEIQTTSEPVLIKTEDDIVLNHILNNEANELIEEKNNSNFDCKLENVELKEYVEDDISDNNDNDYTLESEVESETEIIVTKKQKKTNKTKLNSNSSRKKKTDKTVDAEQILKEDKQIRDFFIMICDFCPANFEKFQNVKAHYRVEHQMRGYLTCCNRKFYKRYCALEHVLRHIDPDSFRCQICKKMYSNKSGLLNHLDSHQPSLEKPFKCEKCPKAFAKKYQYDQHQIRHIPDEEKKFSCEVCGKAFAKNSILQTHIRSVHEGAYIHICEICAKSFKSKMFYEQHCQIFHSDVVMPKVQCKKCGVWLKHEHSLRNHMRKHEEPDKDHICTICGKQAPNKSALRDHERYVHLNERSHKCSICEKAFKRAIGLREHMTTHTGEVLYTCPYCPKTFNSSANMHSHRKKIHPKEWAENRRNGQNRTPL